MYRHLIILSYIFNTLFFRINLAMLGKFAIDYGLKDLIDDSVEFLRTFLQNVFTSAVWSHAHAVFLII